MNTKVRSLIAAGAIGIVGITGIAGASIAGAQTTSSTSPAAPAKGGHLASLTDAQKDCLKANGVTKPDHKLTKDERQAWVANLRTAAQTCDITLPDRAAVKAKADQARALHAELKALTPEQKDCLKANGVTKPDHKLTKDERQAWVANLRTAAQTCNITLA